MNNKLISIFIILIFFYNTTKGNDSICVNRVTIHFIYSQTDTQHDISCSDFDSYNAKGGFMVKTLRSIIQINQFMDSLSNYKSPPLVKRIDVRAKAYVHYSNGKVSIVCIDRFGDVMINGKLIGLNPSLLSFLKKNCNGFE